MFKKTVAGVKNFLEKAFGSLYSKDNVPGHPNPNKKFGDLVDKLPKERQEKIEKLAEHHKKTLQVLKVGIEQAKNGELVERPEYDGLMYMSKQGQQMLTELEGVAVTKYKCSAGVWTVGIGATKTEYPDIGRWSMKKSITIQEAFDKLPKSLEKYEKAVRKALKVDVPQHTFDALVSWCYNVGVGYCKKRNGKIRATVIRLLNAGVSPSDKRVYKAFMQYRKPKEIIGRRKKEAKLLTTGKYTLTGRANLYKVTSKGYPRIAKRIKIEEYLK